MKVEHVLIGPVTFSDTIDDEIGDDDGDVGNVGADENDDDHLY